MGQNISFPIETTFERTNKKDIDLGWFSISHHFIKEKKLRRKYYGKWFCISANGNKIYRLLTFTPNLKYSNGEEEIILDWVGFISLNSFNPELETDKIKIEIRPARWDESIYANIVHPNQTVRAAYRISLVSLILGFLAFFL
jgi:hypothetical protein